MFQRQSPIAKYENTPFPSHPEGDQLDDWAGEFLYFDSCFGGLISRRILSQTDRQELEADLAKYKETLANIPIEQETKKEFTEYLDLMTAALAHLVERKTDHCELSSSSKAGE
jgi:hypothetical protein